jgi:hypothetical protein
LLALVLAPAPAAAFYGNGAEPVSVHLERLEQGDDGSSFAAVSGNGRYVAFSTRARNFFADDDPDPAGRYRAGGIFRRDLVTGKLELVADGNFFQKSDDAFVLRGAQDPSISADGRWVAFHTAQQLVSADADHHVDVYVRDMNVPARSAGAYDLVSAIGPYEPPTTPAPAGNLGSDTYRGAAISGEGRFVVFRNAAATTTLPAGQVLVRDRTAGTIRVVTQRAGTGDPAGGGSGPAGISEDGSTVVWTGKNAPAQARFLNGEPRDDNANYYLWRRMADGPAAVTRRVTGAYDPDDPGCSPTTVVSTDPTATGPCYGPLTDPEGIRSDISGLLPSLSRDGRRVAFLTGAGPRPNNLTGTGLDLYLTDMTPGRTRKATTIELTREGPPGDPGASTPIDSLAMSADGRWAAIATTRTSFVLPALRLTSPPALSADARELYVVDLQRRTVERASRDAAGDEIEPDGLLRGLTISRDGARVAFASASPDHFVGDANDRSDSFAVTRQPEPVAERPPPPPPPDPPPVQFDDPDPGRPTLGARVKRGGGGTLRLTVAAPSAGQLDTSARARVRVKRGRRTRVVEATVARRRRIVEEAGNVTVVLKPGRRYMRELRRRGRLKARIAVTFETAPSGARLNRALRGTFTIKKARKK